MKYMLKKRFSTIQVVGLLTIVFMGIVTIGYAVQFAHDFSTKTGQVISGTQVMDNFNNLNAAVEGNAQTIAWLDASLPIMAASTDSSNAGETCTDCTMVELNTVNMVNLPDGFFVISGTCFINNETAEAVRYRIMPFIDGTAALATDAAMFRAAGEGTGAAEEIFLSYTVTVPIGAGNHIISQRIQLSTPRSFFWNRNNMTVLFIPQSRGSVDLVD